MRKLFSILGLILLLAGGASAADTPNVLFIAVDDLVAAEVTYGHDVSPILARACVSCHRPGEIGPMPHTSYDSASLIMSGSSQIL